MEARVTKFIVVREFENFRVHEIFYKKFLYFILQVAMILNRAIRLQNYCVFIKCQIHLDTAS